MREPVTIYSDPIKSNLKYMLRQDTEGLWCVMSRTGQGEWNRVNRLPGSMHKFLAEETMTDFAYDNGLFKEIMDEEQAGV
jgi:hypothetical protein